MNGKKIFCLSLIVLSVAMGLHWFKHKPKVKKKRRRRPRVALNIDDLQIQDAKGNNSPNKTPVSPQSGNSQNGKSPQNNGGGTDETNKSPIASTSAVTGNGSTLSASDTTGLNADPIIFAFNHLKRNPFECSPYVKLVEKAKKANEESEDLTGKGKETKVLNANFSATIKTDNELVAIIDTRLYRKGDSFKSGKISSISTELVFVNTPSTLFLIPKVGVKLHIASGGAYTFDDTFRKK